MPRPVAGAERVNRLFPLIAAFAFPTIALAQDTGTETAWSVFIEEDPTQCWVVSSPVGTVATRDGADVTANINRGEVMFFISFWPSDGRLAEVSYTGGYPFADGSTVSVVIGEASFDLFTEGEMSWAASPTEDDRIITAMRRGAEAVVTASSRRGTEVADTFSLLGFTAAVEDAEARCGA